MKLWNSFQAAIQAGRSFCAASCSVTFSMIMSSVSGAISTNATVDPRGLTARALTTGNAEAPSGTSGAIRLPRPSPGWDGSNA